MGPFDQNARLACKMDGVGFYDWLLRRFGEPVLSFDR